LQLSVHPEDRKYLTINTFWGLFRYNRLVYGVSSAEPAFQQCMDEILKGLPGTTIYLDDILVAGRTREEAKERLLMVLKKLDFYNVRISIEKSIFLQSEIEYVGHGISGKVITPTKMHYDAIKLAELPKSYEELTKFLWLMNYYHSHIPNLATIA
jgi:hypothetical protein